MIPALSIMVGSYIVLRCVEIILRKSTDFSSRVAQVLLVLMSFGVIAVTIAMLVIINSMSAPTMPTLR